MRIWLKVYLVALGLMVAWGLAPHSATATVSGTSHDLSSTAPGGQLCISCHSPHHVPSTLLLWNHQLSAENFSWGDATQTTGGTKLPTNIKSWSGSSKNCLSCHDGTVEIGKTYNPNVTWDPTKIIGGAQIGPDLTGNHPVAVPYPYNQAKNTYNVNSTGDDVPLTDYQALPTKVKIFADPTAAPPNNRGIECASCHDPHGTAFSSFLRDSTSGSALCLDCHSK